MQSRGIAGGFQMKVVLDLSQLLEDGEITQAEADKLKRLSMKSTGSLAFNILIGFGVIAVAVGAIALVPDATTGIVLGAIVLAFGLLLLHKSPLEWGVLANICIVLGALGLGGGVVYMTNGSIWAFLGCAVGFGVAGVVAKSGLLIALAVMALSSVLGARTGYFHASYFLGIKEPTLTIIAFSLITLAAYQVSLFVGAAYERLALMAARVSILLVNFGFWIGSLWGDRIEQLSSLLGRAETNPIFIPRIAFVIGWALALIAFAVWAMANDRRWVVNVCAVFGAIHFYTQFFERLGPNPLAILLGGVSALGIAIAIWQFNKKAVAKPA
jgi:iron complex transport system permease protein